MAQAQSSVDFNIGFGTAHDSAAPSVDLNTFNNCANVSGEPCATPPTLSGFFLGFGGNLMLWKHFGVGVDVALQPAKENYLTLQTQNNSAGIPGIALQTRTTFYDFDGIYAPYSSKKVAVQLKGGIGGANVKFYENQTSSSTVLGSSNYSQYAQSANHFGVNAGLGVQIYLSDHFFIRPEGGLHYIHNFSQFGSNAVPYGMIWLGYSIGDR